MNISENTTSRKTVYSWALYDWANSVFACSVMAGFFPAFFKEFWSSGTDPLTTTARLGTATSVSALILAVVSPYLGVVADQRAWRKKISLGMMILGVGFTALLSFVPAQDWATAALFYSLALMGFNASSTFYDSLLPAVSNNGNSDRISSLGYALGYLGGGLMLLIHVLLFVFWKEIGFPSLVFTIQVIFLTSALWWFLFSIPLWKFVQEQEPLPRHQHSAVWVQLKNTFAKIRETPNVMFFLIAFWFYIDGVYTVISMAVDYGMSLGFQSQDLIAALLLVQFVGFPFALLASRLSSRFGIHRILYICIGVYLFALLFATQMATLQHFYILAFMIACVQGGVQALSRSLFAKMIPENASAEYFSFYNLVGKFASIMGPLIVGWGTWMFQSPQMGMLSLSLLFLLGAFFLSKVRVPAS